MQTKGGIGLFNKLFGKKSSRDKANNRLRLVLINDRLNSNPDKMKEVQDDILTVIVKHFDIIGNPEVTISPSGRGSILDINIPLKGKL